MEIAGSEIRNCALDLRLRRGESAHRHDQLVFDITVQSKWGEVESCFKGKWE